MTVKFLFDTDFSQPVAEHSFDQEEVAIACRQSYMEGFDAGRLQGLQEIEADCRSVLNQLMHSFDHIKNIEMQSSINAGVIAEKITRALFPAFSEQGGLLEVKTVLKSVLEKLNCDNQLTLYCSEAILPKLKEYIDTLYTDVPIHLQSQKDRQKTDIIIDWKTGFAERNEQALLEHIDTVMREYRESHHDAR